MSQIKHPMRDAPITVYVRIEGDASPTFLAWIEPKKNHPVYFGAATADAAREAARAFANEAADKHEAAFIARQEARAKAKVSREKKGPKV